MTDTSDKEWIATEARKMLHEYGIMTEPYTRSGGDHPMMDFLIRFGKSSFDQGVERERERCASIVKDFARQDQPDAVTVCDLAWTAILTPTPTEGERG